MNLLSSSVLVAFSSYHGFLRQQMAGIAADAFAEFQVVTDRLVDSQLHFAFIRLRQGFALPVAQPVVSVRAC